MRDHVHNSFIILPSSFLFFMASSSPEHQHEESSWRLKPTDLIQYQGFWTTAKIVPGVIASRQHFKAQKDDLMLITPPKSGTTWLKALAFSIINRTLHQDLHNHPLLTTNPHDLVPYLEIDVYENGQIPDLTNLPSPRLFASHLQYQLLPRSVVESGCKIVYLCRNPKDTLVSLWHYMNNILPEDVPPVPMEEFFDLFCRGISHSGPFWEHVLGYWKASVERPERVLFIKYEELREDPACNLTRLADFLGCPFSVEERREGVVEEILKLCSFENLTSLEVNRRGKTRTGHPAKIYFRRGVVGDWKNHLTVEMKDKLDELSQEKLQGSGLTFNG